MNFLGAMGGIGAGLMGAQKVLHDQDETKLKREESALRIKQIQMGITKAQKEVDDSKAYGEIASGDKAEQTAKVAKPFFHPPPGLRHQRQQWG